MTTVRPAVAADMSGLLAIEDEFRQAGTPEFKQLVDTQKRLGPVTSILAVVIIVLMVWKPGG